MPKTTFNSIDEANNVMEQLPPEARGSDSGFVAFPLEGGKYELSYPHQWAGAVKRADPSRKPPPPTRAVSKSLVMTRLVDAGKIDEAFDALWANRPFFMRWFTPGSPTVDSNDPDTIAFLKSLDVDPDAILARED